MTGLGLSGAAASGQVVIRLVEHRQHARVRSSSRCGAGRCSDVHEATATRALSGRSDQHVRAARRFVERDHRCASMQLAGLGVLPFSARDAPLNGTRKSPTSAPGRCPSS